MVDGYTPTSRREPMVNPKRSGTYFEILYIVLQKRGKRSFLSENGAGLGKHIDHAGWTRGYRSYLVVFPETSEGVVMMANGNNGHRLIQEMTRAIAKEFKWPAYQPQKLKRTSWTPEQFSALTGDYEMMPARFTISIVANDDHLMISTPRGTSYTAYPISNTELVMIEDGEHIIISRDDENIELSMWGMKAIRQE